MMSEGFLRWFLSQKPFRPFRLLMSNNSEELILSPDHIGFNDTRTIRIVRGGGIHGLTVETIDLRDIMEIRQ